MRLVRLVPFAGDEQVNVSPTAAAVLIAVLQTTSTMSLVFATGSSLPLSQEILVPKQIGGMMQLESSDTGFEIASDGYLMIRASDDGSTPIVIRKDRGVAERSGAKMNVRKGTAGVFLFQLMTPQESQINAEAKSQPFAQCREWRG